MAEMAQQKAPETEISGGQLALLRNLKAGTHAGTTQELAADVVRLWDIVTIAKGKRPAINDPARSVWDSALSLYGGKAKEMKAAVDALEKIHAGMIADLRAKCSKAEDLGANIGQIHEMARAIVKDITRASHANYKPHFRELIELSFVELGKVVPWKRET